MGLACTLYDEFTYALTDREVRLSSAGDREGAGMLHPSGRNMAFASFLHVWNQVHAA
jgi:homoserine kinase